MAPSTDLVAVAGGNGVPVVPYPNMIGDPKLRWAFVRKVYALLALQFLVTFAVASIVVFVPSIPAFIFSSTNTALAVSFSTLIVLVPMMVYRKRHPVNLVLLGALTVCFGIFFGMECATAEGRFVLQAIIGSTCVIIALTAYTFRAGRRGYDFGFLSTFLLIFRMILQSLSAMMVFFPLPNVLLTVYGCFATLLFSVSLVFETDNLIKRYSFDDYVNAAISLYIDVSNIFFNLSSLMK